MAEGLLPLLKPRRKPFKVSTKKKEWNKAAGRAENDFKTTSKCRKCKRKLIWGSRAYDFDHKDNVATNVSQRNCYLVCKVCHGKATVIKKVKRVDTLTGLKLGHITIKKKVGYKKSTKKKPTKKRKRRKKRRSPFGIRFCAPV
jgi:hypothetical protein